MKKLNKFKYSLAYVVSILIVNIGFVYIPPVPLLGEMFPPMSLVVGLIFILRDFAQRTSYRPLSQAICV